MFFKQRKRNIPSVEILNLQPNDRIVISFESRITQREAVSLREQAAESFAVDSSRIIVISQAKVSILREGYPPPPPVITPPVNKIGVTF